MSWWVDTPESRRILTEERAVVAMSEARAMRQRQKEQHQYLPTPKHQFCDWCGGPERLLCHGASPENIPPDVISELLALADSWDGGEAQGVAHVVSCSDFGCKTCVVIACAVDLRTKVEGLLK